MDIRLCANELEPELTLLRHTFHQTPELGLQEFETTNQIARQLTSWGIPYHRLEPTGIIAELSCQKPGKTIVMRAEIDALPIHEATGLSYASKFPGKMHACGHDMHIAMLLGAAKILKSMQDQLEGTVRFLFQPAEEIAKGARLSIEQGCITGADAFFGLHVLPEKPIGAIGVQSDACMAASANFTIIVRGTAAHGASPQEGVDATLAASAVVMALLSIVSRRVSPQAPLVITIGRFESGSAANVLSSEARLMGTCRYFDPALGDLLPTLLESTAAHAAAAYGATVEVSYDRTTQAIFNHPLLCEIGRRAAEKILAPGDSLFSFPPSMGSDDFGEYSALIPAAFFLIGAGGHGPNHNESFWVDDRAIPAGAALYAQFAIDALYNLKNFPGE